MVKGLKVLLLVVSVLLVVGCMNYKINMSIHDDKSVDVNMSVEIDLYEFASSESMRGMILNEFYQDVCDANCPYDVNSSEYTTCVYDCLENYGSTEEEQSRIEKAIKDYLDEQLSSSEFNEDELFSDEKRQQLEDMGYTVETNLDKENYTYQVTVYQTYANIDDVSSATTDTVNLADMLNGDTNNILFQKVNDDTYRAHFIFESSDEQTENIDISDYIDINYIVNLPNAAVSSNATEVSSDEKTLTWNVNLIDSSDIEYEFSFEQRNNNQNMFGLSDNILKIISLCLIGGGVMGLIIVITILIKSSKKGI